SRLLPSQLATSRSWTHLHQTSEKDCRIALRIYSQMDATPFDGMPFAGDDVLKRGHMLRVPRLTDFYSPDGKPELVRVARERNGGHHNVAVVIGAFGEADNVRVIDVQELQARSLLESRIGAPGGVEIADVVFDVAGIVPVSNLDLVLLGVEIFLL